MEANGFPIAPTILGIVLGGMLEQNIVSSLIKAGGDPTAFFERPIAFVLGVITILVWLSPLVTRQLPTSQPSTPNKRTPKSTTNQLLTPKISGVGNWNVANPPTGPI
jgi:TctA family transporter